MDAARLKRARRRLFGIGMGGGLIWSALFLSLATFVLWFSGVDRASELGLIVLGATVLAYGTYAIFFFVGLILHIVGRVLRGQPIMVRED